MDVQTLISIVAIVIPTSIAVATLKHTTSKDFKNELIEEAKDDNESFNVLFKESMNNIKESLTEIKMDVKDVQKTLEEHGKSTARQSEQIKTLFENLKKLEERVLNLESKVK